MSKHATVVVLGDLGHSPRMCYHALSLADHGIKVQMVGHLNSLPHQKISKHENIKFVPISPMPLSISSKLPPPVALLIKFIWMSVVLFYTLIFYTNWRTLILMQNPPGLPVMAVCYLVARLKGAYLIVDWHNYTWSILRQNYGEVGNYKGGQSSTLCKSSNSPNERNNRRRDGDNDQINDSRGGHVSRLNDDVSIEREDNINFTAKQSSTTSINKNDLNGKEGKGNKGMRKTVIQIIIKLTHWYEGFFGRRADYNLCVSKAMQHDLLKAWNVNSSVLYDKAPGWNFKRLNETEQCDLFIRLSKLSSFKAFQHLTTIKGKLSSERPLILVSSTSWTEDEDFSILLDALVEYDNMANFSNISDVSNISEKIKNLPILPNIICIITGKGPQKAYYLEKIEALNLSKISFITPWLEAEDYPKLLGSADIGVCLHTSTSGIDLPMKVVDMFGCKTPVLAMKFTAIDELVTDGLNGYLFDDYIDLKQRIADLATGFLNKDSVSDFYHIINI
uniref:Glycos_transf_1 domain-containing protein n=1 Tax=Rhabditophanes sp. KR3021 TaxID=114890 RepID=A0AC35TMR6_9BILA